MIDGIGSAPFSATTLPPIAPQPVSYKDMVIAASRKAYARPRAEVEVDIAKFHEPIPHERPPRSEQGEKNGERNGDRDRRALPVRNEHSRELRKEVNGEPRDERPRVRDEHGERTRKPERREEKPVYQSAVQKKDTKTHLEDLRSILKKVVTEETVKTEPPKTLRPHEREVTDEDHHTPPSPPLPPPPPSTPPTPQPTETREALKETVRTLQGEPLPLRKEKPDLSPKELERMMRITTSDKPPV